MTAFGRVRTLVTLVTVYMHVTNVTGHVRWLAKAVV